MTRVDPSKSTRLLLNLFVIALSLFLFDDLIIALRFPILLTDGCSVQDDPRKGFANDDDVYKANEGYDDDGNLPSMTDFSVIDNSRSFILVNFFCYDESGWFLR